MFTTVDVVQGQFLTQYCGELISHKEDDEWETIAETGFCYFFNIMDYTTGTSYGPHLGRLVNHGRKDERTVRMKIFEVDVLFLRCVCLL